jgi:photosystem II stability/assembly factor-like uncharacterized protein
MKERLDLRCFIALAMLWSSTAVAQRPAIGGPWPNETSWRHLGPAAFGGRIDDVEAVAGDPRIIFVGAAGGGAFRSRNGGVSWEAVFDRDGTALSIGDIAIAPSDPNVVWVGTGEPNNRQSSTWGDGVYRSLDGGTTWKHMGLRESQNVGRIVIDPRDARTVFVAAVGHLWGPNEQRGLYRTRDAGVTWQKVLGVDEHTGAVDVAIDPDGRTLYAATYQRRRRGWGFAGSGPGSGLWRSLDGGDSWERITNGLPTGDLGRIGVAIAPSEPSTVYAVIESRAGGVFRSADRGATWTRQSTTNQRASYYSQIRVDPKNPDRLWLLTTYLYASIDAGKSFALDTVAQTGLHPDHHALWIDPARPAHMLLGNDGGLYETQDAGRSWGFLDNLPIAQFYDVAVDDREPYWIYGGAQDNGQWAMPSRTGSRGGMTNTSVINTGYADGFQAAVDRRDPRFVYTESQNGRLYLVDMVTREERWITPVPADRRERYRFNWNTPLLASPNDSSAVYYGANRLLVTRDRGQTWSAISPDLTTNPDWRRLPLGPGFPDRSALSRDDGITDYGTITTISESPKAPGTIWVGTDDGNVQRTGDGGTTWTNLTARFKLPGPRWVGKVLASRHDARAAYVVFDGHTDDDLRPYLFKTTDGGTTWSSIAGDLPNGIVARTIEEHPRTPDVLFAGTELGLYWTFDGGRHWTLAAGNMPRVRVDRVLVHPRTNDLIVATHGRGMIVLDDIASLEGGDPAAMRDDARLFPPRPAVQRYQWRDLPWAGARSFVAPNPPDGALIDYALRDAPAATADSMRTVKIQILGADGAVVRELAGPDAKGVHRVVWDLRAALPFVPAADDSGYYGAYRGPLVIPGRYTLKLVARGRELTQPLDVRADPASLATAEALQSRLAASMRIGELARLYDDGAKAYAPVAAEVGRIRASLKERSNVPPAVDSALAEATRQVDALRPRMSPSYGTPIGRAFDLLGALQSSSLPPTEAHLRVLDAATADLRDALGRLNDLLTKTMPALRTAVGTLRPRIEPVKVP